MPLLDHLGELRTRLIRSLVAIAIGIAVGLWLSSPVRRLLVEFLPNDRVHVLWPGDAFAISFRIALVIGIVLAMQVLLYQLWAFIAPGLTAPERRTVRPWIPAALACFGIGIAIAWLILPYALDFLLAFTDDYVRGDDLAAVPYFNFVTTMFLAFGLMMEFPILLIGLAAAGVLTAERLAASRRYMAVGIAAVAAVVTSGGDITAPLILGAAMYGLFELTLLFIRRRETAARRTSPSAIS